MDKNLTDIAKNATFGLNTLYTFLKKKLSQFSSICRKFLSREFLIGRGTWLKNINIEGFSKNPFFYFGLTSLVLFGLVFFWSSSLAGDNYLKANTSIAANPFFKTGNAMGNNDIFFAQNSGSSLETPDLKIIEDKFVYAISTPGSYSTQTLGDIFGGQESEQNEIIDYEVQVGDTVASLSAKYGISKRTIALANDISENSALKVGQSLVIPSIDGIFYSVKAGDNTFDIAKKYKSSVEKIIAFNNLKNEGDIFPHDDLFLPDGKIPPKAAPLVPSVTQVPVANTFFSNPTQGVVSQGPHGLYGRGVDVANKCGTPIYAAASGQVQRAQFDRQGGNFITIAHANGTTTYYGHLSSILIASGQSVTKGQMIGLMGRTGTATGCHLHLEVRGATNFWAGLRVGAAVSFK